MEKKVTVIITAYNSEKFLEKSISSILQQTFGFNNIELVLVDDCSQDKTQDIINDYVNKYDNVKSVILDENSGSPGKPRNLGMDAATSDYIMFLDADDEYDLNCVEKLYDEITATNADIVCCNVAMKVGDTVYAPIKFQEEKTEFDPLFNRNFFSKAVWDKIYSVKFLNEHNIRFPEYQIFEDVHFIANISLNSPKVISLNNYFGIFNFYLNDDEYQSMTHTLSYRNIKMTFEGFKSEFDLFENIDYDISSKFLSGDLDIYLAQYLKFVGSNKKDENFVTTFDNLRNLELETKFDLNPLTLWGKIANGLILNNHKTLFYYFSKLVFRVLNSKILYKFYLKRNFKVIENVMGI